MSLTREEFEKVDIRVGTIKDVQAFPEARRPARKLWIDFGEEIGIKKTSAQITDLYTKDYLLHKQVVAVINFPPKQIGKFMSECLVLWAVGNKKWTILLHPEQQSQNGMKIS